jgi:hypothetical protein
VAPPRRHRDPLEQVRELLTAARDAGVAFEKAWEATVERRPMVLVTDRCPPADVVHWPTDGDERRAAMAALAETREVWRRAYEGEPAGAADRAVLALVAAIDEDGLTPEPPVAMGDEVAERDAAVLRMLARRRPAGVISEWTGASGRRVRALAKRRREEAAQAAAAWPG